MKIKGFIIAMVLAGFANIALDIDTNQASAQNLPVAVIGVIDSGMVMRESAAGKDLIAQVDIISAEIQVELSRDEGALVEEQAELARQQSLLTAEAYDEKRQAFERKVAEFQRDLQERNNQLEIAINKANTELRRALLPIYQSVLESHQATILIDKNQIILPGSGLDLTMVVIEQLDLALPSLVVDFSGASAE